eukprot:765168-Hanusia_phi.AAC.3
MLIRLPATTRVCLKPMKWNQGGYDAVIVDTKERLVRFVQVTIGKAHDLKLEHHRKCLKALKIGGEAGWEVRIVFIVDKNRLPIFKVSQVKGSLEEFGWIAGEEKQHQFAWSTQKRVTVICGFSFSPVNHGGGKEVERTTSPLPPPAQTVIRSTYPPPPARPCSSCQGSQRSSSPLLSSIHTSPALRCP